MGAKAKPRSDEETREESKLGPPRAFYPSPAGKIRLASRLNAMFDPNHNTYTEAFMGGAACFFAKEKVAEEALSDLDPNVVDCYKIVQSMSDADLEKFSGFEWRAKRSTFLRLKGSDPKAPLERLYKELYLRRLSIARGKGTYLEGENKEQLGIPQHVARARPRLKGVHLYHHDYAETLKRHDNARAFHYLDPPYDGYNHRVGENKFDVSRFRKVLQGLRGRWLVTYGVKGALDTSGMHKMIIRPRRHPAARVGGAKILTTLILTNYKLARKAAEAFEDDEWEIVEISDSPTVVTFSDGTIQRVKAIEPAGDVFDERYFEGRTEPDVDFAALITEVAKRLEGESVLELGCGTGRALGILGASGARIEGVDLSSYAIDQAVAKGYRAIRDDAADLAFADESYDSVFSIDLLGHVPRAERALQEALRVARKRAVHVVRLGKRDDATLVQTWDGLDDFEAWVAKAGIEDEAKPCLHHVTIPGGEAAVLTFEKAARDAAPPIGGFDFVEGDEGTGILQTHERGLFPGQADLTEAFGWEPVDPAGDSQVLAQAIGKVIDPETDEGRDALLFATQAETWQGLTRAQRYAVAKAYPVEIHTDLRLVKSGSDYWEGGEVLTPGSQHRENALAGADSCPIPINLRPPVLKPAEPAKADGGITRGHLAWMDVGKRAAHAFPPGRPGSTPTAWSRFRIRKSFRWHAGVQAPDEKEFWFDGEGFRGRFLVKRADDGWTIERAADQTPASRALADVVSTTDVEKRWFCPIVETRVEKAQNGDSAPKRLVIGVVLEPESVDAQGDIYSADVIEEAAHRYVSEYNNRTRTGFMHKEFGRDIELAESWIQREATKMGGRPIKAGSWLMAQKVNDDDVWKRVQAGQITGFSIGGVARAQRLGD